MTTLASVSTGEAVTFWVLGPLAVIAAVMMVLSRNAVHAALFLAGVMLSLAGLYAAEDAPFLAAVQVIVYTGAVLMLFLFVLMLVGVDSADSLVETLRGQLATERALLDDTGDGVGREAGGEGDDGSHASRTYLDPAPPDAAPTDEELLRLLQQRTSLEADVDELRQRRPLMTPGEYAKEFEALMVKLARVSRQIRIRGKS